MLPSWIIRGYFFPFYFFLFPFTFHQADAGRRRGRGTVTTGARAQFHRRYGRRGMPGANQLVVLARVARFLCSGVSDRDPAVVVVHPWQRRQHPRFYWLGVWLGQ